MLGRSLLDAAKLLGWTTTDKAGDLAAESAASSNFITTWLYHLYTSHAIPKSAFLLLSLVLIVCQFYLLYAIADRHLTWSLEHLSGYAHLSPHLAGLTLLAFGNGAPDFFTAIFGAGEEPELILGSSAGAGLFIVTVVFGLVIVLAKGHETVEDSSAADQRLVLPFYAEPKTECQSDDPREIKLSAKSIGWLSRPKVAALPFIRSLVLFCFCVSALSFFALHRQVAFWQAGLLVLIYLVYMASVILQHYHNHYRQRKRDRIACSASETKEEAKRFTQEEIRWAYQESFPKGLFARIYRALWLACWQFESRKTGFFALDVLKTILKIPFELLLNFTILPLEDPTESAQTIEHYLALRLLHRIRAVVVPIPAMIFAWTLLFLPEDHSILATKPLTWAIICSAGAFLSILIFATTSTIGPPRFFPLHVLIAFAYSILWIYAVSSQLVASLSLAGGVAGISTTIIGILVLAWGNSFGDLVADVALARNGAAETAIAAVFGGPIQNVLLTIGMSFCLAAWRSGDGNRILRFSELKPDIFIAVGTLFLVLLICFVAIVPIGRFRVPKFLGYLLLGIYAIYFPIALLFGLNVF